MPLLNMEHHVAYLTPLGLPPSTEHVVAPHASQSSITSSVSGPHSSMYGQGNHHHHQPEFLPDAAKQTRSHAQHSDSVRQHLLQISNASSAITQYSSPFGDVIHRSGFSLYADKKVANHVQQQDSSSGNKPSESSRPTSLEQESVYQSSKMYPPSIYRDLPVAYLPGFMPYSTTKQAMDYGQHPSQSADASPDSEREDEVEQVHQSSAADHPSRGPLDPFQPPDLPHGIRYDHTKSMPHHITQRPDIPENFPREHLRKRTSESYCRAQATVDGSPESHDKESSSPHQRQDLSQSLPTADSSGGSNAGFNDFSRNRYSEVSGEVQGTFPEAAAGKEQTIFFSPVKNWMSNTASVSLPKRPSANMQGNYPMAASEREQQYDFHMEGNVPDIGCEIRDREEVREEVDSTQQDLRKNPPKEGQKSWSSSPQTEEQSPLSPPRVAEEAKLRSRRIDRRTSLLGEPVEVLSEQSYGATAEEAFRGDETTKPYTVSEPDGRSAENDRLGHPVNQTNAAGETSIDRGRGKDEQVGANGQHREGNDGYSETSVPMRHGGEKNGDREVNHEGDCEKDGGGLMEHLQIEEIIDGKVVPGADEVVSNCRSAKLSQMEDEECDRGGHPVDGNESDVVTVLQVEERNDDKADDTGESNVQSRNDESDAVDMSQNNLNLMGRPQMGDKSGDLQAESEGANDADPTTTKQPEVDDQTDVEASKRGFDAGSVSGNLEDLARAAEAELAMRMNVNIAVDTKWQQVMSEGGFGGRHSEFAEFLLNFYVSNKGRTEMSSTVTRASRNNRKNKKPSRQSRSSAEQVFIIAGVDGNRLNKSGASPDTTSPSRAKTGRKAAVNQPRVTSVNRRKDGQRTPRKRKMDESYLPYSPVPIYKTKPNEPLFKAEPDDFGTNNENSTNTTNTTGMVSFSDDSSLESGVDADDHASDVDFRPSGYQSDSADDDKPLKFRRSKLRSRSTAEGNTPVVEGKIECEYTLEHNNPRAPLKIKFKQSRKLTENQPTKKNANQAAGGTTRTRKPRKPAKPKKTVRAKRPPKPKPRAEDGEAPAKRGRRAVRNTNVVRGKGRGRNPKPIVKVSWVELIKQYQCKICQYDSPCITDMSLHLLDRHMDSVVELARAYAKMEVTCSSRTATVFEFLTGRKYEDRPAREEEPVQPKRLPPVSGILSSILSRQEADNRGPPTSEIVMTALSQALPPATNAMAFLHAAPPRAVISALSATGALPYIPGVTHPVLGDGSFPSLSVGGFSSSARGHEGYPSVPNSVDTQVSLLAAAAASQASSISQTSSETDAASPPTDNRHKTSEVVVDQATMPSCHIEPMGLYLSMFRKSGVDVEQLSKAIEVDLVINLIEKWVKIRTQCPNCLRNIRVSKRTNMHRCKGSEDKPVYVLCDVCGNSYQKEYFSLHYNRIHLQSLVSCHVCSKKFTPSSLPKHLFKHTNPPSAFKCGTCPKSFRFRMDLERHELVHRVDKPYMCPTCGRGFTQKSNMQYHMRQHTGEQPYKCDNCMKSFTHNVSLKNHLKKHHGIDLWAMGYTGGGRPKKEQSTLTPLPGLSS